MATGWVKSLQCRSRAAADDVFSPNPKALLHTASCRKSIQGLKDVITQTSSAPKSTRRSHHQKHRRPQPSPPPSSDSVKRCQSAKPSSKDPDTGPFLPALSELPEGHPSRNVVEIIFHTRWGPKPFPGRVQMVFKIQNIPRTVARFEDYRETVKRRTGSSVQDRHEEGAARCMADGNEMMRFQCVRPTSGVIGGNDTGGIWAVSGGKGFARVCTFAGSGAAHDSAGGGTGMRAMLVCRVIAGRVWRRCRVGSSMDGRVGFDSVSGEDGELMVFDSRAVLPCFLVLYKL
ncbi:hypothetical protein Dimus_008911 [Dionaea muscipula]